MSLISFLNAVGASGDGTLGGDLEFLGGIAEADRYYKITEDLSTPGVKHSIPIPTGKKFVIISITIVPTITPTLTSYAYVDLKFADNTFDRIYYDNRQTSDTKKRDATYGHAIVGDGIRQIDVDLESIQGVPAQVIILGYYADRTTIASSAIRNFTANELSPDDIRLSYDAPFDNGGNPIIGYRIRRSDTVNPDGVVIDFITIADQYVPPNNVESGITFDDTNLEDNKQYYYKIFPITTVRLVDTLGAESIIATAKTEIDHPEEVRNLTATKISSTQARLTWEAPLTDGGVTVIGYLVQRSLSENTGFTTIVDNTDNISTSYDDSLLSPGTKYFYRLLAINSDGKLSLIYSNIASVTVQYTPPSNLRDTISSDSKNVLLEWDVPTDVNELPIAGYRIEQSLDGINFSDLIANTQSNRTNYTDRLISGGTIYIYRVSVIANGVIGPPSDTVRVEIPIRLATAPQNFVVSSISDSKNKISWSPPLDNGGTPLTGYKLEQSKSIGFPDGTSANSFVKTNSPAAAISGLSTIIDTITVAEAQAAVIGTVKLDINITHTWRGDIEIVLTAPTGESITLKTVNFADGAPNIIETFDGNIFNGLIGHSSLGIWTIKVRDAWGGGDDGTFNSWKLTIEPALDSLVVIPLSPELTEYENTGLTAETTYFYRIRAVTNLGDGDFSVTQNVMTPKSQFGDGSDGDLTVPANTTMKIIGDKQYDNVTIETGAILEIDNSIIKINGKYTENGTGKTLITKSGCPGGIAGMTFGGGGGFAYRAKIGSRGTARPATNGSPGTLTPPGVAPNCTDSILAYALVDYFLQVNEFESKFKNQISGGKGSNGTVAAGSGTGGRGGTDSFRHGRWTTNHLGGRGGVGAQGVMGVRGGGKFALFIREVVTTLRIDGSGNIGNNGNKGTAAPGVNPSYASAGSAASATGTLGSKGSQGGIVYVLYETLPTGMTEETLLAGIDVLGGLGGYNGAVASSSTPNTTTRADTGPEGIKEVAKLSNLT